MQYTVHEKITQSMYALEFDFGGISEHVMLHDLQVFKTGEKGHADPKTVAFATVITC